MNPNIIQIVADDMGYGDFGIFNEGRTQTPALDALSREGLTLTQHYSASPLCAPARASLLTGRYPHRTGAIEVRETRGLCNLALDETTIADVLRENGYSTGLVGKWHNGSMGRRFHPNARGFEEFVGFRSGWQDYYNWTLNRNGAYEKGDGRYLTDVFTDEAIEFLRRHRNGPFFLHLAYNAPHNPLQAPEEDIEPFRSVQRYNEDECVVYGMIRRMDRGLERLFDELSRLGMSRNTLVMFTSDNGPSFYRFNCDYRGKKGYVYEGGIRVPMIMRWPDGLSSGKRMDETIHFCDWFPTLLTAADLIVPDRLGLDGVNVLGLLQNPDMEESTESRFWQFNRYRPCGNTNAAIRDGDWKLVRPALEGTFRTNKEDVKRDAELREAPQEPPEPVRGPVPPSECDGKPPPTPQLFNIREDREERNDLADKYPDRVRAMSDALDRWMEDVESERSRIEIWPDDYDS